MRVLVWLALVGCGAAPEPPAPDREACAERNPLRNLYWGDLHVHTSRSFDAWIYDVRLGPRDAYAFARGEEVGLPPLDENGEGLTRVRLERPLDFAAVTDHSEYLAEVEACTQPGSGVYDSALCVDYRLATPLSIQTWGTRFVFEAPERFPEICGVLPCLTQARDVWSEMRDAAEEAYDRTAACGFTSFVGYEWSATPDVSNLHRNVIFRTEDVPALPLSTFDASTPEALWSGLDTLCTAAPGDCEFVVIPHNSNQSNGHLFPVEYDSAEAAEARRHYEPLFELFQHKGDSECRNGLSGLGPTDEQCDFEKLRGPEPTPDCLDVPGTGGIANLGCQNRSDFYRGLLLVGLEIEQQIGVNPYEMGVIASTDTHNGTPGLVSESNWPGHLGLEEGDIEGRLDLPQLNPGGVRNNPGGLAAVWAEENSRDAIFDALRRRETYGTSGPRIAVRAYAGELPDGLCERDDALEAADRTGVPMGGEVTVSQAPRFWVRAWMDPGTDAFPGTPLQSVQIIKASVGAAGSQIAWTDVASEPVATLDLATCTPDGSGATELCVEWTDDDWQPGDEAIYYVRVLEQPTCRWSWRDCLSLPESERPEVCSDPTVSPQVQERAWTSPIRIRSAG